MCIVYDAHSDAKCMHAFAAMEQINCTNGFRTVTDTHTTLTLLAHICAESTASPTCEIIRYEAAGSIVLGC